MIIRRQLCWFGRFQHFSMLKRSAKHFPSVWGFLGFRTERKTRRRPGALSNNYINSKFWFGETIWVDHRQAVCRWRCNAIGNRVWNASFLEKLEFALLPTEEKLIARNHWTSVEIVSADFLLLHISYSQKTPTWINVKPKIYSRSRTHTNCERGPVRWEMRNKRIKSILWKTESHQAQTTFWNTL